MIPKFSITQEIKAVRFFVTDEYIGTGTWLVRRDFANANKKLFKAALNMRSGTYYDGEFESEKTPDSIKTIFEKSKLKEGEEPALVPSRQVLISGHGSGLFFDCCLIISGQLMCIDPKFLPLVHSVTRVFASEPLQAIRLTDQDGEILGLVMPRRLSTVSDKEAIKTMLEAL